MSYVKADEVLPQNIIAIIQQYIDGESIYIPSCLQGVFRLTAER